MSAPALGTPAAGTPSRGGATRVAAGILLSRLSGLVRSRVVAQQFGLGDAADAFTVALRIPNFLQNLLGEGVLSASFIPVYARLAAQGEREEADRVAGVVFSVLALVTSLIVLVGVLTAPWLVALIGWDYAAEKRDLVIRLVRICFPGAGLLVLSAWCLGVLNSHGKFLLSYAAAVFWNVAIVGALILGARSVSPGAVADLDLSALAVWAAWGSVAGSALQLGAQLPSVLRSAPGLALGLSVASENVKAVWRNFVPALVGRGVIQISLFIEITIASGLGRGAAAALSNAQIIYLLPVSLFAMSVSAAEIPAMAAAMGTVGDGRREGDALRARLEAGMRRVAFYVLPSAVAFLALGAVLAEGLFGGGRFGHDEALIVWAILCAAALELLPVTLGRLYSSGFYALRDARTPMRFAILRVALDAALGAALAFGGPALLGIPKIWGTAGLALGGGIAGWVELHLLRSAMEKRVGRARLERRYLAELALASIAAAGVGWTASAAFGPEHAVVRLIATVASFGATYFAVSTLIGIGEARAMLNDLVRMARLR